jgi:hypothetical protein
MNVTWPLVYCKKKINIENHTGKSTTKNCLKTKYVDFLVNIQNIELKKAENETSI